MQRILICLGLVVFNPLSAQAMSFEQVIRHLHQIGVTTSYQTLCGHSPRITGMYSNGPRRNHLCIRKGLSNRQFTSTFLHELVHVAQDCIGGGIASPSMGSVTRYLSKGDRQYEIRMDQEITRRLARLDRLTHVHEVTAGMGDQAWIEHEAYYLQDKPKAVIGLLKRCR